MDRWEEGLAKRIKSGETIPDYIDGDVHVLSAGDVNFIGLPGEIVVGIGLRIKKEVKKVINCAQANGFVSYIPTKKDLQDGGGSVDLGTVLCVEDNSGDTTTAAAYDDPVTPAVGQAFFYLFRGSMGAVAGPGSYGTGSNGDERVPSGGDCSL